jgi:tripartite-type tricarboxylate transporter receptor subunit TctC
MPVPTPWPLVARGALDPLVDAIKANPAGVALVGNEGVGKTTLAAMAAQRLDRGEPLWVIGTLAASSVPVGAFGPLLDCHDAGTPAALVQRLNRELVEIARQPDIRALLESDGALPTPLNPAEVAVRVRDDLAAWKKIATDKNITAE